MDTEYFVIKTIKKTVLENKAIKKKYLKKTIKKKLLEYKTIKKKVFGNKHSVRRIESLQIIRAGTTCVEIKKGKAVHMSEIKNNAEVIHAVKKPTAACGFHCIKMKEIGVKIGSNQIIEHVNLHIHCGKITCIIGKNGAGKSTLIKAIVGEIKHEGTIEFKDMKDNGLADMRIGYVPQHLNISKNTPTSVYDLFAGYISRIPVFLCKSKKLYQKIKEQLALFEAQDLIDKAICDLSGGELQRVMLSIATMPIPNLMLLDEPISGVDHNGMELFYRNIDRLRREYDLAIILVSHDFSFVKKYADYVILLDKTIVKEGSPKEVLESKEFIEIFGKSAI